MDEKSASERYAEMVQQPYDVEVIRRAPDLDPGDEHPSVVEVQNFLKRFGYLDAAYAEGRTAEPGRLDEVTVRALIEYQHFSYAGSGYGNLDAPTREAMAEPRCGVPDVQPGGMLPGPEDRYWIWCQSAWQRRFFTYAFGNVTSDLPLSIIRALVARAFSWAWGNVRYADGRVSGLSFHPVERSEFPDFLVEWVDATDTDYSMVGNVTAHSDVPSGCPGEIRLGKPKPIHFDDSEHTWTGGAKLDKLDIQTIAIHEIGHLLGLGHSSVMGSIMSPTTPSNFAQHTLADDDIGGLSITMRPMRPSGHIHFISPDHAPYKVLDVAGISQANGAKIQLWEARSGSNQSFRPEYAGGGAFRFVAEHSGKVLTVEGGSTADGAQIIQWDWHEGNNQRFVVHNPRGTQQQLIIAVHSRKVLDVAGASQANGAKIQQWTPPELPPRNQLFSLTK